MPNAAIIHDALEWFGWSVESRNVYTEEGFESVQSLNSITHSYLKILCTLIRNDLDPVKIGVYK